MLYKHNLIENKVFNYFRETYLTIFESILLIFDHLSTKSYLEITLTPANGWSSLYTKCITSKDRLTIFDEKIHKIRM